MTRPIRISPHLKLLKTPFLGIVGAALFIASCNREFVNPSDPSAERFTQNSEAFIQKIGTFDLIDGDTARLVAGVTSKPVSEDGLVVSYAWDLDGDGTVDTVLKQADTLNIVFHQPGQHQIRVALTDQAGFESSAQLNFPVRPTFAAHLSLPDYDTTCPAYAQVPLLMRLPLVLSHFTIEKTQSEGLENAQFAWKLAQAITGVANPIGMLDAFDYNFSKGVYHFHDQLLQFDVSFHYGPGISGHAEGDTILKNLFDLDSYVKINSIHLLPPSVDFSRGPLASLIDADLTVNIDDIRHPQFDFKVDFNRIRFSFVRHTQSLLVLSNQSITLANALFFTLYQGKAHLWPIYPGTLIEQFEKDSLTLDFSGTRVTAPDLPIYWAYSTGNAKDSGIYHLSLTQETLRHDLKAGNASGTNKVMGTYAAINRLGTADFSADVYFQGQYSTLQPDSAKFFCHEPMDSASLFGIAAFETETANQADFESYRYNYHFTFPFSTVDLWSGPQENLPLVLRNLDSLP